MVSAPCWVLPFQLASTWPQELCQRSSVGTLISLKPHRKLESSLLSHRPARQPSRTVSLHPVPQAQECSLEPLSSRGCSTHKRPLQSWVSHCPGFMWHRLEMLRALPMGRLSSAVISYSEAGLKINCSHIIQTTKNKSHRNDHSRKLAFWFCASSILLAKRFLSPLGIRYLNLFHCFDLLHIWICFTIGTIFPYKKVSNIIMIIYHNTNF